MSFRYGIAGLLALASGVAFAACGEDSTCTPGQQVACACGGGQEGFQTCNADGTAFGACVCGSGTSAAGTGGGASSSTAGGGAAGPASSGATTTSSTGAGASGGQGSGGAATCDGTGQCEDSDPNPDNDCFSCAIEGPCKAAGEACANSVDCLLYNMCIQACGSPPDPTCKADCDRKQPLGSQIYSAAADCFCGACPTDCADSFCKF